MESRGNCVFLARSLLWYEVGRSQGLIWKNRILAVPTLRPLMTLTDMIEKSHEAPRGPDEAEKNGRMNQVIGTPRNECSLPRKAKGEDYLITDSPRACKQSYSFFCYPR